MAGDGWDAGEKSGVTSPLFSGTALQQRGLIFTEPHPHTSTRAKLLPGTENATVALNGLRRNVSSAFTASLPSLAFSPCSQRGSVINSTFRRISRSGKGKKASVLRALTWKKGVDDSIKCFPLIPFVHGRAWFDQAVCSSPPPFSPL